MFANTTAKHGEATIAPATLHSFGDSFYVNYNKLQIVFLFSLLNGLLKLPTSGKQMSLDLYVSNAQFIKPV